MQTLVEEIEKQLKLTKVYKGTKVTKLSHSCSGYSLELDNGVTFYADSVIVTAPHKAAAGMLSELPAISHLKNMHSTSVANVALGFPEGSVQMEHEGTGFVISRNSDFAITACTWTNKNGRTQRRKAKRCFGHMSEKPETNPLSIYQIMTLSTLC